MWLSGGTLAFLIFLLPETSPSNILYRRARRLRKLTGNDKLVCEAELAGMDMTPRDVVSMALVRPFVLLFAEPIVLALDLYIALVYGLLYIWFESFPLVFEGVYGFSLGLEGLAFLGILVGVFVVLPPFVWYQHRYIEPKFNADGELKPEWRLPPAFVGAFAIPVCLFWFGWTARPDVHWIVPIIGTAWFSIGAFLLFNCVMNYLSDAYPTQVASVLAGNDLLRSMVGAGFVSRSCLAVMNNSCSSLFSSHCSQLPCTRSLASAGRVLHWHLSRSLSFRFHLFSLDTVNGSGTRVRMQDMTCKMAGKGDVSERAVLVAAWINRRSFGCVKFISNWDEMEDMHS